MYPELAGKNALVTGAVRGFGKAIAIRLAAEGVKVVINYRRSMKDAKSVVDEIIANGGQAIAIRADVGKPEALDRMFDQIKSEYEYLDILIANAAFGIPGYLMEATGRYWDITMSASARSLLDLAQRTVPLMRNGWGRIVSITSDGGQKVIPGYGVVGPAKGALEAITRGLAYELGPKGIVVNGVSPGLADTKSARSIPGSKVVFDHSTSHTPMGRMILPDDVAKAVAFLVSDQASMMVGQFLVVDGGRGIVG